MSDGHASRVSDSHHQSTLDAVYVYVVPWSELHIVPSCPHYPERLVASAVADTNRGRGRQEGGVGGLGERGGEWDQRCRGTWHIRQGSVSARDRG